MQTKVHMTKGKLHILKSVQIRQCVYYNEQLKCWRFRSNIGGVWRSLNKVQIELMFKAWDGNPFYHTVTVNNFKERT